MKDHCGKKWCVLTNIRYLSFLFTDISTCSNNVISTWSGAKWHITYNDMYLKSINLSTYCKFMLTDCAKSKILWFGEEKHLSTPCAVIAWGGRKANNGGFKLAFHIIGKPITCTCKLFSWKVLAERNYLELQLWNFCLSIQSIENQSISNFH